MQDYIFIFSYRVSLVKGYEVVRTYDYQDKEFHLDSDSFENSVERLIYELKYYSIDEKRAERVRINSTSDVTVVVFDKYTKRKIEEFQHAGIALEFMT